MMSESGPQRG
jgi:hypothetical protein